MRCPVLLILRPRRRCHNAVPSQHQYEQNVVDTNKGHLTVIPRPLRNDLLLSVLFLEHRYPHHTQKHGIKMHQSLCNSQQSLCNSQPGAKRVWKLR